MIEGWRQNWENLWEVTNRIRELSRDGAGQSSGGCSVGLPSPPRTDEDPSHCWLARLRGRVDLNAWTEHRVIRRWFSGPLLRTSNLFRGHFNCHFTHQPFDLTEIIGAIQPSPARPTVQQGFLSRRVGSYHKGNPASSGKLSSTW